MDRNRLVLFIAISAAILFGFQILLPGKPPHRVVQTADVSQPAGADAGKPGAPADAVPAAAHASTAPVRNVPRVGISAPRVEGSISLVGARLDDLRLRDYHDTVQKSSPLVRLLAPADDAAPSSIQLGWTAVDGTRVPDDTTLWTSSGGEVTDTHPVTLSWDNGAGQVFKIEFSVDRDYMFQAHQSVHNGGGKPVSLVAWQRVRRDWAQPPATYGVVFEGLLGVTESGEQHKFTTHQIAFPGVKKQGDASNGTAYTDSGTGGWSGFSDKYWLTAVIPDQGSTETNLWYFNHDDGTDHYQVSYQGAPASVAPGADAETSSRLYAGAKEVHLLDRYEAQLHIPLLSYAVDWGHFFFLTKPIYYAIDFLYSVFGNFGVAIILFTTFVKVLFYPLASNSYRSMGKMRLLGPKIQAARERYKDDPAKQQAAMMEVYKEEGVNPAAQLGGCLPMLLQIPVFFSLYKVILVTIEMRHAPFFGWIRDLSATDPTNIFNLFGVLPFDPSLISPTLHLGVWPLLLGASMFFQQKLNPPPPDPVQARMFQFMPLIFMFMMGRFPAGLVVYWTWNNTLTIGQQWYIQRGVTLDKAK
jgi:YidC/Oxa1 family membrane protein insertase